MCIGIAGIVAGALCAHAYEYELANPSFESGSAAYADGWTGVMPGAFMRTNVCVKSGSWSIACVGGVAEWANVLQVISNDLDGQTVELTCWMYAPSDSKPVAWHPDWFQDCSAILKMEEPASSSPISEVFAIKNEAAGGVYDTWIHVTNRVAIFPSGKQNFKLVLLGVMTSGTIYYDDVRMTVVPEPGLALGACLALLALRRRG